MESPIFSHPDSQLLRQYIRRQRRELSIHYRRQAGHAVVRHIRKQSTFMHATKIGLYIDAFGEIPTQSLIKLCLKLKKSIYFPVVIAKDQPLAWAQVKAKYTSRMTSHRFGMKQPSKQRGLSVMDLDVIFMPLVAYDDKGHRLGMGGGFYDRSLSRCMEKPFNNKRSHRQHFKKPYRVGMAYDFQRVDLLETNPWDISLHAVVTPTQYQRFNTVARDSFLH
ncbi:5-formyltetrahydrofolate cyclo-ligase [Aquirhabdus parva]|uniref:5-formyltetrahydrofolate cyclo-ligase n=1 Tax=Aquirhabdus parva TaxID=2283318 RepID=UPI001D187ADB|nr:5-formyltetrahydrofolate cyclo-ligase [Aquirhabdus parva]